MHIINVDEIRLHVRDDGPRDGRVVMFANSLGTDLRVWDDLLPLLPEGLRIIRYDKAGHGLSDCPEAPYSIEDLAKDAEGIIDQLGLTDVTFVGLSIGGLIAQKLAAERPDVIKAVVLMNTAAKIGTADFWRSRIEALMSYGYGPMTAGLMERWFTADFRKDADQLAPWINMVTRTPIEGYAGCCSAIAGADLTASTAALAMPVMAMVGDQDGATPPELVKGTAALLDAPCHIIENAGHIPCVEQPAAVAALLKDFLETTR